MTPRTLFTAATLALAAGAACAQAELVRTAAALTTSPTAPVASAASTVRALLVAQDETTLASPVAGTIRSIRASLGSPFGHAQVLVAFECEEPRARLVMAQAELSAAVEQHEAKVRMQGLQQASDVEVATAAAAAAKAQAQTRLHQAQIAQCTLTAPWSGRVARLHARAHMTVTQGQPLLDLVRGGPLKLKLHAPSRRVQELRAGSVLKVAVDETGKTYDARVLGINSRVDAASQTVEIEAQLGAVHAELLPGMSGVVAF